MCTDRISFCLRQLHHFVSDNFTCSFGRGRFADIKNPPVRHKRPVVEKDTANSPSGLLICCGTPDLLNGAKSPCAAARTASEHKRIPNFTCDDTCNSQQDPYTWCRSMPMRSDSMPGILSFLSDSSGYCISSSDAIRFNATCKAGC